MATKTNLQDAVDNPSWTEETSSPLDNGEFSKNRNIVVVLGMHRSGTSAITRGLQELGIGLGDNLMGANPSDNPKGYWEDLEMYSLNDKLLAMVGRAWDDLRPIASSRWVGEDIDRLRMEAIDLVTRKTAGTPLWGFKDPRTARLLPFWKPIFEHLGLEPRYLICIRHPLSVAHSLTARAEFPLEKSCLLWLEHTIAAVTETHGASRIVVDYDLFIENPVRELERVHSALHVGTLDLEALAVSEYVRDFLEPGLRHSRYPISALNIPPVTSGLVQDTYTLLLEAARDHRALDEIETLDRWAAGKRIFREVVAFADYFQGCATELEKLRSETTAQNSALSQKETEIRAYSEKIAELTTLLKIRDDRVTRMSAVIEDLNLDLAERESRIANLRDEICSRDARISSLAIMMTEGENRIARLASAQTDLENLLSAIHSSTSWKITAPLRLILRTAASARADFKLWGKRIRTRLRSLKPVRPEGQSQVNRDEEKLRQIFDDAWYLETYPDVAASGIAALDHYLAHGAAEGRDPNALFNTRYYLETCPDVAASDLNPLIHFLDHGASEGRKPHPLFDIRYYLETNPDVAQSGVNPLAHFLAHGASEGRSPHPLFDTRYYLRTNPDVAESGLNPLAHFLKHGASEGRNPHPLFITHYYIEQCQEIAVSGENPLEHYLRIGAAHGLNPNPVFDGDWYFSQDPNLAVAGINPLVHYIEAGSAQGWDPSPLFCGAAYVEAQGTDLDSGNALAHFLHSGRSVAPGAYLSADALMAIQRIYLSKTETRLIRDQRHSKRPFAVYLQCGAGLVWQAWLSKAERAWDLIVNHYDATHVGRLSCEVEYQQVGPLPGTKFTSVHAILRQWPSLLADYEYVLLLDDDILIGEDDITSLFEISKRHQFDLAQASLSSNSHGVFAVLKSEPAKEFRYINAVEIMMPLISQRVLSRFGYLFGLTVSGWGLDIALGKAVSAGFDGKIAVIDSVVAEHSKPIDLDKGSYYRMLREALIAPQVELRHMQRLFGLGNRLIERLYST